MNRAKLCVEHIENCPKGHAAEFGVCYGDTLAIVAKKLKQISPEFNYYGFDCWEGLPFVSDNDGDLKIGECKSKKETVLDKINNLDNVILVDGLIEDNLPKLREIKFSFCFLDMDIYSSTKFVVDHLSDEGMVSGGIMGFHDYKFERTPGITKCVDELDKNKWKQIDHNGICIFFKKIS